MPDSSYLKTALEFVVLLVQGSLLDIANENYDRAAERLEKAARHIRNAQNDIRFDGSKGRTERK